ncbi:MAG: hypothetical protein MUO72_12875 [Bacteroidales bacterium]|nr:hypothetical protein [Bacteroidales bacterium]
MKKEQKMTFSGFDDMTITRKIPRSHQKINRICAPMTIPADRLKIEIPINKITSATYNKDNKTNKLVTFFALRSCSQESYCKVINQSVSSAVNKITAIKLINHFLSALYRDTRNVKE